LQGKAETGRACKIEQVKPEHYKHHKCSSKVAGHGQLPSWEPEEEEERHDILEEGIPQQLKAFIAVVLLAGLGSQRLQHIHYVGQPAAA